MFVGGNVRLGYVRLRGKRLGSCNIVFFKYKKKQRKNKKTILWSKTIISRMIAHVANPGIIPPKFLWAFHHSFNELRTKKKIFVLRVLEINFFKNL